MAHLHKSLHILLAILLLFVTHTAAVAQKPTTIILLRHAEKDTMRSDPPLTEKGRLRAEHFRNLTLAMKPDMIYSSPTVRTINTVLPLAQKTGITIEKYDPATQEVLAKQLKDLNGKTVVVVGHSNTIPRLANLLVGAEVYCDIPDREFGWLWIVTIENGEAHVVVRKYE